jgi:hypothetical protein
VLARLIDVLGRTCAGLSDTPVGDNAWYSMRDIALAGFSVFFMQSPSFLAHQRQLAEGSSRSNCEALFGVNGIPTDNHVRAMLDPVSPDTFHPVFGTMLEEIDLADRLAPFRRLGGHTLIALDGTEYLTSSKIHCSNCSQRRRSNGGTEYFHTMLSATLVAPGHREVVPLAPEFIAPQDGARTSRLASSRLCTAGWTVTARPTAGSRRPTWAMTCSPVSPPARPCWRPAGTSCSSASPARTS